MCRSYTLIKGDTYGRNQKLQHTYKKTIKNNWLYDKYTLKPNKIFEAILLRWRLYDIKSMPLPFFPNNNNNNSDNTLTVGVQIPSRPDVSQDSTLYCGASQIHGCLKCTPQGPVMWKSLYINVRNWDISFHSKLYI